MRYFTILLVTLIALSGCKRDKQVNPGGQKNKTVPVEVMVARPSGLANTLTLTGTLLPDEMVELRPEISGKLVRIGFEEGSRVQKGQLLVKLRDDDLRAQLSKLHSQERVIRADEQRKKKLLALNGISQDEYDQALSQLDGILADIALVGVQIDKTEIRAPFSGVIGLRQVSEGCNLSPADLIARLEAQDPLKLEFNVPEKYAAQIQRGMDLSLTTEGSDQPVHATVYATETGIDEGTRSLRVRAHCPNPQLKLRPGAFARVNLLLQKSDSTIEIPTNALLPQMKGYRVYTCDGGTARAVDVITGLRTDSTVQILSGLMPGDSVIVTGLMQLKNGTAVKVRGSGQKERHQVKRP